jgi:hypothetical protein
VCTIKHTPIELVDLLESLAEKAADSYPTTSIVTDMSDVGDKDSFFHLSNL